MPNYRRAPDVAAIAAKLIKRIPDHKHLNEVRVEYVFIEEAPRHHGKVVLGRARRIGGLGAVLADLDGHSLASGHYVPPQPFFVVEISEDVWRRFDAKKREALVDHELMHCKVDHDSEGSPVLKVRPHDFEEFAAIIRRHGLWTNAADTMAAEVTEQLALAVDEATVYVSSLTDPDDVPPDDAPSDGDAEE